MTLLTILTLGFFLGMRHATDADHVIAVTTLVSREKTIRMAGVLGALWGIGHTATILVVGGAIVIFGIVLPLRLGLTMEFSVALMLIALGVMNLLGILRRIAEIAGVYSRAAQVERKKKPTQQEQSTPQHNLSGAFVYHPHTHFSGLWARLSGYQQIRPVLVGIVHGLAGSAAIALLVLTTIRNPLWALLYLVLFGFGTIVGMMVITSVIAIPVAYTSLRFASVNRHISWVTGLVSVVFGLFLVYHIGVVDGLFTASPHWQPR